MAEIGEMGPVEVDVDLTGLKQMQQDMFAVMNSHKNVSHITIGLDSSVYNALTSAIPSYLSGSITAKECAADVQAAYEAQIPK